MFYSLVQVVLYEAWQIGVSLERSTTHSFPFQYFYLAEVESELEQASVKLVTESLLSYLKKFVFESFSFFLSPYTFRLLCFDIDFVCFNGAIIRFT